MDAILDFKKAAQAFQNDDRYLALEKARKANDEDAKLQGQIGEFQLARMNLNSEMQKPDAEQDSARLETLNTEVNGLYSKIMANENMIAYNKAKDDIESFMEYVNAVLNAAIAGENPMEVEAPAQGCGGSCSSCSGC